MPRPRGANPSNPTHPSGMASAKSAATALAAVSTPIPTNWPTTTALSRSARFAKNADKSRMSSIFVVAKTTTPTTMVCNETSTCLQQIQTRPRQVTGSVPRMAIEIGARYADARHGQLAPGEKQRVVPTDSWRRAGRCIMCNTCSAMRL